MQAFVSKITFKIDPLNKLSLLLPYLKAIESAELNSAPKGALAGNASGEPLNAS